ncbi:unnamed protein product [Mucor hiemalis]
MMTSNSSSLYGIHPLATPASSSSSSSPSSSSPSSPPMSSMDDVTTIFVVGFPDDMQEREFQNMFIFSKGFEAASLKWHCRDQQEDQDMFSSILNNKKQMIGFARFRSRLEASEAANLMNGKRVDNEKGSILKAEMAKKNLHIKRNSIVPSTTTSTSTAATLLPSAVMLPEPSSSPMTILSRRLSQAHPGDLMPAFSSPPHPTSASKYESFSPLPSDLLSPGDYKHDPFLSEHLTTPNTPSFNDSLFGIRSLSFDARNGNPHHQQDTVAQPFPFFSKSFSSEIDTDSFNYMSKSTPVPHHDFIGNGFFNNHHGDELLLLGRKNSLQPSNNERSASISSFRAAGNNPGDQNPPCNTLYVGNLPSSTNEDELRSLFANCGGYKRMCFRNKPQGPMCFVEFDDVVYATQAMTEHQGHALSNSIKGGIRLSFSKNPLFIKPNKEVAFNFKQMGTALLADL